MKPVGKSLWAIQFGDRGSMTERNLVLRNQYCLGESMIFEEFFNPFFG
jgi:hypothetical protein